MMVASVLSVWCVTVLELRCSLALLVETHLLFGDESIGETSRQLV